MPSFNQNNDSLFVLYRASVVLLIACNGWFVHQLYMLFSYCPKFLGIRSFVFNLRDLIDVVSKDMRHIRAFINGFL